MKKLTAALTAHVDAGKTTLAEALLHTCGAVRSPGRVDRQTAAMDHGAQEKKRGITIFAGEASLTWKGTELDLIDTPGHVDFSPETERVLAAADVGVLVISGLDGVQAHTLSLWKLLEKRGLPVILFVSKMDAGRRSCEELLEGIRRSLSDACLPAESLLSPGEDAAMLDEALLERYLGGEPLTEADGLALIRRRSAFPVIFGSGLKEEGVSSLLDLLEKLAPETDGLLSEPFAARVYKISYDEKGTRLTHMKCLSGRLAPRDEITYPDGRPAEKVTQLRRYTGGRFVQAEELSAGSIAVAAGLAYSRCGDAFGTAAKTAAGFFEPVMSFHLVLPEGLEPDQAMLSLKKLEEEDPSLHLRYDAGLGLIFADLMGNVQAEVLTETVRERFGWSISLGTGRILYKETLAAAVEGVGHYEPLRHYAEVHLALRPLPRGSGIVYADADRGQYLAGDMRRLILGQLEQIRHRGVLAGGELTDVQIVLLGGRYHEKHTEGGDFREAARRAVRQGLMEAKKQGAAVLLEPYVSFEIAVPPEKAGRVFSDVRARAGGAEAAGDEEGMSLIRGRAPLALMQDYAAELSAFTGGRGRMRSAADGYDVCHDTEAAVAEAAYDPVADRENPPDSVFCRNGGGFSVPWDEVPAYMHLPYLAYPPAGRRRGNAAPAPGPHGAAGSGKAADDELEAIMLREFGPIKRPVLSTGTQVWGETAWKEPVALEGPAEYIVDGYNLIFAWPELKEAAEKSLDLARERLEGRLQSFAAFTGSRILLVFDGWRVAGGTGSAEERLPLSVVYTAENETADIYIERELGERLKKDRKNMPAVVSNDNLIRLCTIRLGGLRIDCESFAEIYEEAAERLRKLSGEERKKLGAPVLPEEQ